MNTKVGSQMSPLGLGRHNGLIQFLKHNQSFHVLSRHLPHTLPAVRCERAGTTETQLLKLTSKEAKGRDWPLQTQWDIKYLNGFPGS